MGEQVAVVGLGGVGLAALLGARAGGARKIIAVDANPSKAEVALQLGADHFVDARDPEAASQIRALSQGGVELAAEFAGVMPALELAIAATRRGGRTVTAALPNPNDRLSLQAATLVTEERALLGSYVGSSVPSGWPCIALGGSRWTSWFHTRSPCRKSMRRWNGWRVVRRFVRL
jgi:alcohol dehydrogenase